MGGMGGGMGGMGGGLMGGQGAGSSMSQTRTRRRDMATLSFIVRAQSGASESVEDSVAGIFT